MDKITLMCFRSCVTNGERYVLYNKSKSYNKIWNVVFYMVAYLVGFSFLYM